MAAQPYRVELAKSDRSTCTATREKIAKGELRLGALVAAGPGGHGSYKWRKLECVTAKQVANVNEVLGGPERVDGFSELAAREQAKVLGAFAAAGGAPAVKKTRAKPPGAEGPAPPAKKGRAAAPPALPAASEAAAHALLDLAKGDQWNNLFRALDTRPELVNVRPEVRQFSLLHQAIYLGRAEAVARLLDEYGADPAQRTKAGEPCSALADARASPEIAALVAARTRTAADTALAEAPADLTPEKVCKKATEAAAAGEGEDGALEAAHGLLDLARDARWSELFAALDKRRELVDARPAVREHNALHQAAYHGDRGVLAALIDGYGADPAVRTKAGLSAEEVARERGHALAAEDLRARLQGSAGTGAVADAHALIDLAKDSRWPELLRALEGAAGDLVNVRPDVREFSVLHQAAYHGEREVVVALLDRYGADPAARSRSGKSAAEVAEERGHMELAQEIQSRLQEPDDDCDMVQKADGSWAVVQRGSAAGPSGR